MPACGPLPPVLAGDSDHLVTARCAERRTPGAAGGPGKPTRRNPGRAPRSDPTNLAGYAEKTVVAHRGCLKDPAPDTTEEPGGTAPAEPDGLRDVCGRERRLVTRTRERHAAVHQMLAAGHSLSSVSRTLSLDRKTVQRSARQPDMDKLLVKATSRDNKLNPFKPWINQRWNQGITDAAALHTELQARGWTGSVQAVRRYVRPFRATTAAPLPQPALPKARQITSWLLRHPENLSDDEQAHLPAIRARCPHIDALAGHVTSFAEMMTRRSGDEDLEDWLSAALCQEPWTLSSMCTSPSTAFNSSISSSIARSRGLTLACRPRGTAVSRSRSTARSPCRGGPPRQPSSPQRWLRGRADICLQQRKQIGRATCSSLHEEPDTNPTARIRDAGQGGAISNDQSARARKRRAHVGSGAIENRGPKPGHVRLIAPDFIPRRDFGVFARARSIP